MAFAFVDLDETTRAFMLDEWADDEAHQALYLSPWLTEAGRRAYPSLLGEALRRHDPEWLAEALRRQDFLNPTEERLRAEETPYRARVPYTAPDTLAEAEFNRYYMRGVCRRALAEGWQQVEVYRGKQVVQPRPNSQTLIGQLLPAQLLLEDLRGWPQQEPALGLPTGFNSGLTLRRPVGDPT